MRNTPTKVLMKSEIGNTRITEYLHDLNNAILRISVDNHANVGVCKFYR